MNVRDMDKTTLAFLGFESAEQLIGIIEAKCVESGVEFESGVPDVKLPEVVSNASETVSMASPELTNSLGKTIKNLPQSDEVK